MGADVCFGLLGGSFDPIHYAHLLLAETVRTELHLDKILFVPCQIAPHKPDHKSAAAVHRLAMIELAIRDNPAFDVCSIELEKAGVSYTVDTLEALHTAAGYGRDQIYLIVGADNLASFQTWKAPDRILQLAHLVGVNRPNCSAVIAPGEQAFPFIPVNIPMLAISASAIRNNLKNGRSIRYWTPRCVEQYIHAHGLYIEDPAA